MTELSFAMDFFEDRAHFSEVQLFSYCKFKAPCTKERALEDNSRSSVSQKIEENPVSCWVTVKYLLEKLNMLK